LYRYHEARCVKRLFNAKVEAALHAKENDLDRIAAHRDREAEILAELHGPDDWGKADVEAARASATAGPAEGPSVGLYKLNTVDPGLESTWFQPLSLRSDILVSQFAFTFNLCRYTLELEPVFERPEMILEVAADEISSERVLTEAEAAAAAAREEEVGRYTLNAVDP
jgi:hypothetical protein